MFCANCGKKDPQTTLCQHCSWDPSIPEVSVDEYLKRLATGRVPANLPSAIEYPGEQSALALAIAGGLLLTLVLGGVTFGLFLVFLALSALQIRFHELRTRLTLPNVSESYRRRIYRLAKLAAFRLKQAPQKTYVQDSYELNAHCAGFWGRYWIVLNSRLLTVLTPTEILFVIGHEMGHIRRHHTSWLLLMRSSTPVGWIFGPVFNQWSLRAEYSADRAGLLACREVDAAITALAKIQYGGELPADLESELHKVQSVARTPLAALSELFGHHPFLVHRIEQLQSYNSYLERRAKS